jgi:RHS repeat-associated protein
MALVAVVYTAKELSKDFVKTMKCQNYRTDPFGARVGNFGLVDRILPRLHEQYGYGYDKAGNLNERTNNALIQSFAVNDRNELSSASQSGTLTVAGTATMPSGNAPYYNGPRVTSVTVNGQSADIYEDGSFGADGFTPVTGQNTYTAIAQDNFNDAQGNVVALASPGDTLLAQYKYDPFGNLISKSGPMADINKYRFSSKEWEENAGLYYYLYRFYDPNLQRWVSRDPIQEASDINLLRFAINSPLCFVDSFGLDEKRIPIVLPSGRFPGGVGVPVSNPPSGFHRIRIRVRTDLSRGLKPHRCLVDRLELRSTFTISTRRKVSSRSVNRPSAAMPRLHIALTFD